MSHFQFFMYYLHERNQDNQFCNSKKKCSFTMNNVTRRAHTSAKANEVSPDADQVQGYTGRLKMREWKKQE